MSSKTVTVHGKSDSRRHTPVRYRKENLQNDGSGNDQSEKEVMTYVAAGTAPSKKFEDSQKRIDVLASSLRTAFTEEALMSKKKLETNKRLSGPLHQKRSFESSPPHTALKAYPYSVSDLSFAEVGNGSVLQQLNSSTSGLPAVMNNGFNELRKMTNFDLNGRPYRSPGTGFSFVDKVEGRRNCFSSEVRISDPYQERETKLMNKPSFKGEGQVAQFLQKSSQNYTSYDSEPSFAIELKKDSSAINHTNEKQRLAEITTTKSGHGNARNCSVSFGEGRKIGDRNALLYEQDTSAYEFHGHDARRSIKSMTKREKQKRMLKKKSRTCLEKEDVSFKEESDNLKNMTVNENFLLRTVPKYSSQDVNDTFKSTISSHGDEKKIGDTNIYEKKDSTLSLSQSFDAIEKAAEFSETDITSCKHGLYGDSSDYAGSVALLNEDSRKRRGFDLLVSRQAYESFEGSDSEDASESRPRGSLDDVDPEKQLVTNGNIDTSPFLHNGPAASKKFEYTDGRLLIEDEKESSGGFSERTTMNNVRDENQQTSGRKVLSITSDYEVPVLDTARFPLLANVSHNQAKSFEQDYLSEMIWKFHLRSLQTELTLARKLHLRDALYYSIASVFPMCGLYVVGSSLNGFGSNSSDMDLCLMITDKELDQRVEAATILQNVKDSLKNARYIRELQFIPAKIPILRMKFKLPYDDIVVDLNANNSVSIRNTHLLSYYSAYDWRVRPLVSIVKEWAKRRDINDANRSSFTSYSLVLMVIHYLQCGVKPAILPSLQVAYPKRFGAELDVRTLNASARLEDVPGIPHNASPTLTLGDLLTGFFHYYAFEFDYVNDAISVRLGRKIERQFVASRQTTYTLSMAQWNCICIEEPFTRTNTAHSMHNEMLFDSIRKAFSEDYKKLSETQDLDTFLDVKPIAPLPFVPSRSCSGLEAAPTMKKNLLEQEPFRNARAQLQDPESAPLDEELNGNEKEDELTKSSTSGYNGFSSQNLSDFDRERINSFSNKVVNRSTES